MRRTATPRCAGTDPEIFFPDKGQPDAEPKRICFACQLRAECLEYALQHNIRHGIWGGKSAHERHQIRRRRTQAAA